MNNSRFMHSMVFSLIAAIPVMLLALLIQTVSDDPQSAWNYLSYLILFGALLFGQMQWRDKGMGGFMTYGQGFKYTLLFSLWYSIIMAIWTIVFFMVISPDMTERILELSRQQMEKDGMPEDQIEIGIEMARKFTSPAMMAVYGLIGNFVLGLLLGLITSAIAKKDKPVQPFQPLQ